MMAHKMCKFFLGALPRKYSFTKTLISSLGWRQSQSFCSQPSLGISALWILHQDHWRAAIRQVFTLISCSGQTIQESIIQSQQRNTKKTHFESGYSNVHRSQCGYHLSLSPPATELTGKIKQNFRKSAIHPHKT